MPLNLPPERKLPGAYNKPPSEGGVLEYHPRNSAMIYANGGKIVNYRDLPAPARMAIAHYMAIDGEAWDCPDDLAAALRVRREAEKLLPRREATEEMTAAWEKTFAEHLPFFTEKYGDWHFGYVSVPMTTLIAHVLDECRDDWNGDFGKYHDWYMGEGTKHKATGEKPWPVILSSFKDDTIEDGWNRFHLYYDQKRENIPCVWFPMQQSRAGAAGQRKKYATSN